MNDCTGRHVAAATDESAGEGQEGLTMTAQFTS
jgi:hypothetical protein